MTKETLHDDERDVACNVSTLGYHHEFGEWTNFIKISLFVRGISRTEHYQQLLNLCQSDLKREWLAFLEKGNYRLPSHAQHLLEGCQTRPDFFYEQEHTAMYVDGPHHLYPERITRDQAQMECMEDTGYTVVRFPLHTDWEKTVKRNSSIFGSNAQS